MQLKKILYSAGLFVAAVFAVYGTKAIFNPGGSGIVYKGSGKVGGGLQVREY